MTTKPRTRNGPVVTSRMINPRSVLLDMMLTNPDSIQLIDSESWVVWNSPEHHQIMAKRLGTKVRRLPL